jgi:hypothetical protein
LIPARGPTVSGLPSAAAIKTASMANTMGAPKVNPGTRRAPRLGDPHPRGVVVAASSRQDRQARSNTA